MKRYFDMISEGIENTGQTDYRCQSENCGRGFSSAQGLHLHQRRKKHFVFELEFGCVFPLCGQSFADPESLDIHKKLHDLDRPFLCSHKPCGKTFTNQHGLEEHKRRMHPVIISKLHTESENLNMLDGEEAAQSTISDSMEFYKQTTQCLYPNCNRTFKTLSHLRQHHTMIGHNNPISCIPRKLRWNKRNLKKMEMQEAILHAKQDKHIINGTVPHLRGDCKWETNKIWQRCITCGRWLERTPRYYKIWQSSTFDTCLLGLEVLCKECRECTNTRTGIGEVGLEVQLKTYPHLSLKWAKEQLMRQGGCGLITNFPLILARKAQNAIGVHRYDNSLDHIPSNCFFECRELNVPQHDAVPSLIDAWKCIFQHIDNYLIDARAGNDACEKFQVDMLKTLDDLGIKTRGLKTKLEHKKRDKEAHTKHFRTVLLTRIQSHILFDIKAKLVDPIPDHLMPIFKNNIYSASMKMLKAQNYRCFYSGYPLTVENGFARLSFERVNNKLAHFNGAGEIDNI
jgi:hypothetical protein